MKLFSQYDRFCLEEDIIKLWETNEMIDELIRRHLDSPEGPLSDDEFANKLDGIKHCNDLRIQRIWDGYEVMLKNGAFPPKIAIPDVELFPIKKKGKK